MTAKETRYFLEIAYPEICKTPEIMDWEGSKYGYSVGGVIYYYALNCIEKLLAYWTDDPSIYFPPSVELKFALLKLNPALHHHIAYMYARKIIRANDSDNTNNVTNAWDIFEEALEYGKG